ncbi:MAG: hypothetical protein LBU32_14745 [Clostridiales bacterium]|nr:hypothetical protein [Clostridiales bacterium]
MGYLGLIHGIPFDHPVRLLMDIGCPCQMLTPIMAGAMILAAGGSQSQAPAVSGNASER